MLTEQCKVKGEVSPSYDETLYVHNEGEKDEDK
jgi:hypothetical protein